VFHVAADYRLWVADPQPMYRANVDGSVNVLEAAAGAGATNAGFLLLRLPLELAQLFEQWLREHYPDRADRVLNRIREIRGGRLNDPRFGHRMRGEGSYAELLSARFDAACRRLGLATRRGPALDTTQFVHDPAAPEQRELFAEK
jgi:DNA repair photolyase